VIRQKIDRNGPRVEISLREGKLPLRTLELRGPVAAVTINGAAIDFRPEQDKAMFDNDIVLESGSTLAATLGS